MKEIRVERGMIVFEGQNSQTVSVSKKDPYKQRQKAALNLGIYFIRDHSEQVLNLLGADTSEELDLLTNPDFLQLARSLKDARVSCLAFKGRIHQIIETSPHCPPEPQINLIANSFTSYVYGEIRRLGLERKIRV